MTVAPAPTDAPAPTRIPRARSVEDSITWTSRSYHVLTHGNTQEVMLGTNAVPRVDAGATFHRDGNALRWRSDPAVSQGWSFDALPEAVWAAIATGRCFLVEFGPTGPLTEHDVVLVPSA